MVGPRLRDLFANAQPDVRQLDERNVAAVAEYLIARGLLGWRDAPVTVERLGKGNMNLTLRVIAGSRSLIVKQGRSLVEGDYDIKPPRDRTLFEAAFYQLLGDRPAVAGRLPALRYVDRLNGVLVLEDFGNLGDFTSIYTDGAIAADDLCALLEWLSSLARVRVHTPTMFTNREMRRLLHARMFVLPLRRDNGLDLELITPGLTMAAALLQDDRAYVDRVAALGVEYLSDGPSLVHGDFSPGSWIRTSGGPGVVDFECGFRGERTFDHGVMLAHCALAHLPIESARQLLAYTTAEGLDEDRILGFAGVEIMRRLIGFEQLPLRRSLDDKRRLLELSLAMVTTPRKAWTSWP